MKSVNILERINSGILLFDGGMGTELYNRGIFINQCFEALNLTNPSLVEQIHKDYKSAGAEVIQANTFGANILKLKSYDLAEKIYDINFKGVEIAKKVADDDIYVAGSIGPLGSQMEPLGPISKKEARQYFKEQIKPQVDAGADILVIETFIYPYELKEAVIAAREISDIPVIAMMTIDEDTTSLTGAPAEFMIIQLESTGADIIGVNGTCGPQAMLRWLEIVRPLTNKPISLMPFAGKPKEIDGRNIYLASPEYLGEYAKHYIQAGANVIGGSSGIGPEHIKRMRNTIAALKPELKAKSFSKIEKIEIRDGIELIKPKDKSRLSRRIEDGHFVTFVELLAPKGIDASKVLSKAKEMHHYGIDVINIPDGPRASARMSALALATLIRRDIGIETVLHYVCRDRNVIGMQSDLLGAHALGLKNILAITGDPPKIGNYPDATAVFDVDAIGLVNILNRLNHGEDIAGNPIGDPTGFHIGVGANPGAVDFENELRRLDWKIEAGAEYVVTQPVFDLKIFEKFINKTKHLNIPIIAGLWPLVSIRNAEFMNNEVPGCDVPEEILKRLRKYQGDKEAGINEGIEIARETLDIIKNDIAGIQISAPFGRVESVIAVLEGFDK